MREGSDGVVSATARNSSRAASWPRTITESITSCVFNTRDDYFDYYRNYHAFWKLYGIDLPDSVLKKIYNGNALRITPGLQAAFAAGGAAK